MNDTTTEFAVPQTIVVEPPPATLLEQVDGAVALGAFYARGGVVSCQEMRDALSADMQANAALQKVIEAERVAISKPINEGLRRHNALFKRMSDPLLLAMAQMKAAARAWDDEQERLRLAAAAEAARVADAERRRLAEQAAAQQAAGNVETAAALADAAQFVAPIPVAPAPKLAGETKRETWCADEESIDVRLLARAVADGVVPSNYVLPNMPVLNGVCRGQKEATSIPGVKARRNVGLAVRSKP